MRCWNFRHATVLFLGLGLLATVPLHAVEIAVRCAGRLDGTAKLLLTPLADAGHGEERVLTASFGAAERIALDKAFRWRVEAEAEGC